MAIEERLMMSKLRPQLKYNVHMYTIYLDVFRELTAYLLHVGRVYCSKVRGCARRC